MALEDELAEAEEAAYEQGYEAGANDMHEAERQRIEKLIEEFIEQGSRGDDALLALFKKIKGDE